VGRPQDVADVVLMLLTNLNMTGAVIDVDAGALLV
jgi:NAD(P)-dependent dehydrogenase (short-subunit alcohol dehydrogenase family)